MLDHYKDGRARFFYDSCTEVFNEDGPAFIGAHQLFFKEMIELDLLEKQQDLVAVLTTNGNNIIEEFGSWLKYKESQTTRHKRLVEAESKKGKVETVRWWGTIGASLLGGFLGGLSTNLFQSNKEPLPSITITAPKIDSLSRAIDSLTRQTKRRDKKIEKLILKVDSLSQPPKPKKKK